jgi:hydroxypyruvate isomerase
MSLKFCANLSFMFQEATSLLERYQLAKDVGFQAVECAFPYVHSVDEIVAAQKKADVEQILINAFVGKHICNLTAQCL